jgi:predicted RNase H-like nuclease (RuvC/YqgF family)
MRDIYTSLAKRLDNTDRQVRELALRMINVGEEGHESETVNPRIAEREEVGCLEEKLKEKDRQIGTLQRQLEQSQRLLEYYEASFWHRWFKRKS